MKKIKLFSKKLQSLSGETISMYTVFAIMGVIFIWFCASTLSIMAGGEIIKVF